MTGETALAAVTTILGAVTAADHFLARADRIIQNSFLPFIWAVIRRQPIKAQPAEPAKENNTMAFLDDVEAFVAKMEELSKRGLAALDNLALFAEKAAPVAAAIAPMTGSAAPAVAAGAAAAGALAPVAHEAIQGAEAQQ